MHEKSDFSNFARVQLLGNITMALSTIEKLEQELLAAKKAARTTKTMRYKEITAPIKPAQDALAAAQSYKLTLVNDVKLIDDALRALANGVNLRYQQIVNQVNALNEQIAEASEDRYLELVANIESLRGDAELLKLRDYKQDSRYSTLKQDRNAAVSKLASHITVINALEAVS